MYWHTGYTERFHVKLTSYTSEHINEIFGCSSNNTIPIAAPKVKQPSHVSIRFREVKLLLYFRTKPSKIYVFLVPFSPFAKSFAFLSFLSISLCTIYHSPSTVCVRFFFFFSFVINLRKEII